MNQTVDARQSNRCLFMYIYCCAQCFYCSLKLYFSDVCCTKECDQKKGDHHLFHSSLFQANETLAKKGLATKTEPNGRFFFPSEHTTSNSFFSLHRPFDEHAQINKKSTSNTAEALKSPAKISVYSNFVYFHCCHFH